MNPNTGFLEFQQPLQQHIYDYTGLLCISDHRSLDFALTPNHKMYVRKWNEANRILDDNYSFTEIKSIGWYAGLPHATTGWLGTEFKKLGVGKRVYNGDDFLALLGLILSDGWVGGSESTKNTVSFCCFREDRIEMVREFAYRMRFNEVPSRPGVWMWADAGLAEWLRQNVYINDNYISASKHIPTLVKCASQRQIEHFLRFFGDQHIEEGGTRRFYSSSRLLIDDLQELLLRIGKRGTIEEREPRKRIYQDRLIKSNGPDLTLTERKTDKLSFVRKENFKVEQYKGNVYCATVPNHLLVTRRNGSILVSGNSCWDFSGTGTVEIAYNKAGIGGGPNTFILSEQYTLDCGNNGGCNGDDNTTTLAEAKATGIPLTSAYGPYEGGRGLFGNCKYTSGMILYKINDWGFADSSGGQGITSTADIKSAIMAYGCVGSAIAADNAFSNNPPGTVFQGSGSTNIDHDIILVGWDDSKGAWKLRNSWGSSWCDNGYCWIVYGANQVGTEAVFAVVNPPTPVPPTPVPPTPVPPTPVPPTPVPPTPVPPTPVPPTGTIIIDLGAHAINAPSGWTLIPNQGDKNV